MAHSRALARAVPAAGATRHERAWRHDMPRGVLRQVAAGLHRLHPWPRRLTPGRPWCSLGRRHHLDGGPTVVVAAACGRPRLERVASWGRRCAGFVVVQARAHAGVASGCRLGQPFVPDELIGAALGAVETAAVAATTACLGPRTLAALATPLARRLFASWLAAQLGASTSGRRPVEADEPPQSRGLRRQLFQAHRVVLLLLLRHQHRRRLRAGRPLPHVAATAPVTAQLFALLVLALLRNEVAGGLTDRQRPHASVA